MLPDTPRFEAREEDDIAYVEDSVVDGRREEGRVQTESDVGAASNLQREKREVFISLPCRSCGTYQLRPKLSFIGISSKSRTAWRATKYCVGGSW